MKVSDIGDIMLIRGILLPNFQEQKYKGHRTQCPDILYDLSG